MPLRTTPSVAEQEAQQIEKQATGAPQKHHQTLNQKVGSITQMLGINQVVAHNGNGGRERIGETGTVLGLNARDSKHAGRMFSMHNCQINPGAGPEITTPWKSYQHEKNRNGLLPLIRRRTMLQL
ncbi:DUF4049 domain-containing protein [Mycolicibacterium mageritense]|uniref:DUF4049 domain-containing protein n=1 Tax=Mycolicibacterium mageritense TaxID=53462 RepID=UPI001E45DC76